ncbi:hypothetical protein SH661x_000413 [Planctomicrobium sp. SH661]|uniref:hypothetical protein n=1 Tax=Planctomicrobium sp. SH661 TaxID=3448124 RepID=UPI003F5B940B
MSAPEAPEVFGLEPVVESIEHLPIYMRAITKIRAAAQALIAKRDKDVLKLDESLAEKQLIDVDGETISRVEYANRLEKAVCDFARDHKDEMFAPKRGTWKCEAGSITTKTQPEKVSFVDPNTTDDEIIDRIIKASDLLPEFDRIRAEFAEAFPYLRISLELDKAGILKAFQAKQLEGEDLEKNGLKIGRNPDKYTLKLG